MASTIYDQRILHTACGQLTTADVNTGTVIIPNDTARRIFIVDAWVRAIGSPGAGTAIVYLREYRPNVVCSNVSVNDTVTINGLTFTAKATAAFPSRQWSQAGTDTADGDSLAALINDPTWGVRGVKAVNAAGTVTLIGGETPQIASSNTTRLAVDSGGNSFMTVAKAGLSNGVITRAGSTNAATCTYLSTPGSTRYPVEIRCTTGDLTTTTALDYVVKYTLL